MKVSKHSTDLMGARKGQIKKNTDQVVMRLEDTGGFLKKGIK